MRLTAATRFWSGSKKNCENALVSPRLRGAQGTLYRGYVPDDPVQIWPFPAKPAPANYAGIQAENPSPEAALKQTLIDPV